MKKFITYSGLLLGLSFCLSYILASLLDQIYIHVRTGQTGGKINDYLRRPIAANLLIMGDSRALYQINPDSFSTETYNLCHAGMSQSFQTGLYSIISHERNPKVLLLQVAPFEYTGSGLNNTSSQNLKFFYHKNDTVTTYINSINRFEHFKYWFDLYRYNGRVIPLLKNAIETYRLKEFGNGYVVLPPTNRDSLNTLISARIDSSSKPAPFNRNRLRYLSSFITLCKKNNTKLICFTSPVYYQTQEAMRGTAILDSLLTASSIPYINYINHPLPEVQSRGSYWKDSKHLNAIGGSIQSHHLAGEVNKLLRKL